MPMTSSQMLGVGDKGIARQHAGASIGAEHVERVPGCFQSEGDHFYRKRTLRTESVHHLAAVERLSRGDGSRLRQSSRATRPPESLDQIERAALNLVSTVDREIDLAMLAE
jgi:hypothetical protein